VHRAKNETAANCAVVIDVGWNGSSRDSVDMKYLARRPRQGRAVLAADTTGHSNH
jgi:hypothetical protein